MGLPQGRESTYSFPLSKVKNKQLRPFSSTGWEPWFSNISAARWVLLYKFMSAFCLKRKLLSNFRWACIPLILFLGCLPGELDKPLDGVGRTGLSCGALLPSAAIGALFHRAFLGHCAAAQLPFPFLLPFPFPFLLPFPFPSPLLLC